MQTLNTQLIERRNEIYDALANNASSEFDGVFGSLTSKPTTIAGYGIIDAFTQAAADLLYAALVHTHTFASLTSTPTTIAGYGITDQAWTFSNAPVGVLFSVAKTGVDLKSTNTADIFTVPTGKTFVCVFAQVVITAVTGAGAGTQQFKIIDSGTGGAMTPNTASGSGTAAVKKTYAQPPTASGSPWVTCAAPDKVQIVVTTSQAGSTSVTGTVYVHGFYY